jgi:hypothetical protein
MIVKPSKASFRTSHSESACDDGNRRSIERGRNQNSSNSRPKVCSQNYSNNMLSTQASQTPAKVGHRKLSTGQGGHESMKLFQQHVGHPYSSSSPSKQAAIGCRPAREARSHSNNTLATQASLRPIAAR